MKKIILSPFTWIVVTICVILVLYCFGFKITYAPELENSWEAVSACAAWASVLSSFIAIIFAVQVPKKIAEEQNKIALFEKKYSCFNAFSFLLSAIEFIVDENIKESKKKEYFDDMAEVFQSNSVAKDFTADCISPSNLYVRLIFESGKIQHIFNLKEMDSLLNFLLITEQYIADTYKGKLGDKELLKTAYNTLVDENIIDKLEEQLKI